jgi:hypothetical protein
MEIMIWYQIAKPFLACVCVCVLLFVLQVQARSTQLLLRYCAACLRDNQSNRDGERRSAKR